MLAGGTNVCHLTPHIKLISLKPHTGRISADPTEQAPSKPLPPYPTNKIENRFPHKSIPSKPNSMASIQTPFQQSLAQFVPEDQPTKRHTASARGSKLEYMKLKLQSAEWSQYIEALEAGEVPPGSWRHLETLYGVETQIKHNSKEDGVDACPITAKKTRAGMVIGGAFAKNIQVPAVYMEELQQFLSNADGHPYTKEDVADIVNEQFYKMIGMPMMRAFYEKAGHAHVPMGEDYWCDEFMGGIDQGDTEERMKTLEDIKKCRGERAKKGRAPRATGPRAEDTAMIDEQRREIERLKALIESQGAGAPARRVVVKKKPKKFTPKKPTTPAPAPAEEDDDSSSDDEN